MIKEIVEAVTIPVMAKVRIGHFVEAQVRYPVNLFLSLFLFLHSNLLLHIFSTCKTLRPSPQILWRLLAVCKY
jgi:hypothetical protein